MIKENIKIHDKLSFEIKFEFPASKNSDKNASYLVNMFLFLPYALDINKHTFSKDKFYNSLKTYVRLTTPVYLLKNMIKGGGNPLRKLKKSIKNYSLEPNAENKDDFELQVKRFCSIFGSATRNAVNHILSADNIVDKEQLIDEFYENVIRVRNSFKELRKNINIPFPDNDAFDIYKFADEYQSLLVERHLFLLLEKLEKKEKKLSTEYYDKLNSLVLTEMEYRESMNYPSVAYEGKSNEDVLHRSGRLKKFIESNLFLNTDTKRDGVIFEQMLFAFAAGLAMVFATGVAFASQMIYGNLTMTYFIALVISYMFKDRIKELGRMYFDKKHHNYYQDFKTNIYDQRQKKIGFLKEGFQYVKHKTLLPEILEKRNKIRSTEITKKSMGEKILLYRNKIKIINKKVKSLNDFNGITEILRLNISGFTKNMDDPEKEIFVKTKKGFKKAMANRTYHLTLILDYSIDDKHDLKAYKLIVDRNGIKRIENYNKT